MVGFIDDHRPEYGVEPIRSMLPIARSTYHEQKARQADLSKRSDRIQCDLALCEEIERVWKEKLASTACGTSGVS